ncbi:acyltransferase [Arthrobacter sp. zg-Y411]|uniref:acyltransferase family protein n=1 Tax=Arthrobacter zhangbolii TaxID=2886936 RepID=UPI001D141980|nr:acyltransferase [Arthrobacter zhangbolii]
MQGLRALAVLMVASYHIWFNRVSGGVDVFLLISAFLLSLSFIRKVEAGRGLDLLRYWVHVFKRLLPAVAVVIVGTLVASAVFVPRSRWSEILSQAWSSLLYFQNWVLAANSVDYYAADHSVASPFQHFWSLSVQGQVFILWPLLFALAALIARAAKRRFRAVVLAVFGTVFVVSLAFSVSETYTNQAHAYFDTRTRLWEFAFGTLLALALPYLKLPRGLRVPAGWVGLAAILSGGFILDVQGQFPGFVALWPLVAAALVILAGQTGSRWGVDRVLSWGPLVRMGDMSYALYLWHWPVLVIYLIWRGRDAVGPVGGAGIILLSLALAWATTRFIEQPLRSLPWAEKNSRNGVIVIAVCVVLAAAPVFGWQYSLKQRAETLAANADVNNPGAAALIPGFSGPADDPDLYLPDVTNLETEAVQPGPACSDENRPASDLLASGCGEFRAAGEPDKRIIIVGDSHSLQWFAPMQDMAQKYNWQVITLFKGACNFGLPGEGRWPECDEWNLLAHDFILEQQPDAVLTVGTAATPGNGEETAVPGLGEAAEQIMANGTQVVTIRDNPRFSESMIECVEENGNQAPECNQARLDHLNAEAPFEPVLQSAPGIQVMDLTDYICGAETCPAVVGNVYVYLDSNHLSKSYLQTLGFEFERQWFEATGW